MAMVYSDFWLCNKYILPHRLPVTNRAITSLHPSYLQRGLVPAVIFSASLHYRSVTKHSIVQTPSRFAFQALVLAAFISPYYANIVATPSLRFATIFDAISRLRWQCTRAVTSSMRTPMQSAMRKVLFRCVIVAFDAI
jgi:hypothetical protein